MNCNNISNIGTPEVQSPNKNILENIMELPPTVRKEVRLLAKQYDILSVHKEPDTMLEDKIIRTEPYIITYKNIDSDELFEWELNI